MKSKTARIFGILISALVLFASCGQLAGSGESRVSINLPYVNNANSRAVSGDALQRIKGEHASYRVHINDRVLEGAGGNFSAYFPVGTKVDVFIECVSAKGEVILRTVTKSLVVASGENTINFNLKADGNEITPSVPSGDNPPSPQPVTGRVTYAGNGDYVSGTPTDAASYNENDDVSLSAQEPVRPGYKFNGWKANTEITGIDSAGLENTITAGVEFASVSSTVNVNYKISKFKMPSGGVVLTAEWTPITYTVNFNGDGAQGSENPITFTVADTGRSFPSTTGFTNPGHTFQHWATGPSGTSILLDYIISQLKVGNSVSGLIMSGNDITVYAVWEAMTYNITYSWGTSITGVTGTLPNAQNGVTHGTSATVEIPADVSRPGYEFLGWSLNEGNSSANYTSASNNIASVEQDYPLYAVWRELDTLYAGSGGLNTNSGARDSQITITKAFEIASASSKPKTILVVSEMSDVAITQTGGNITLDLAGCTVTGNGSSEVINITGGELTLKDSSGGGKITGGSRGVNVGSGTTFTMNSGEISGNIISYGAGVYVNRSSTFNMTDGKICGNTTTGQNSGGGVYVEGTFIMSGGEISGNEAAGSGGGVYLGAYSSASFTMSGSAVIKKNISNGGGGVCVASRFTMNGGTIEENTANEANGGSGKGGGGVYVNSRGTIAMNGGAIEGNTATSYGGGICVNSATGCAFEMNAGTISNNAARNGSGVYTSGTFTMNGGTISHHTAGYGVYLSNSGNPIFNGNGTGIFEDNSPGDYSGTYSGTQTDNSDSWTH